MEKLSARMVYLRIIIVVGALLMPVGNDFFVFAENPQELRFAWDPWPPYQYIDDDGPFTGLDIELVSAIARDSGLVFSYRELPWKRILFNTEIGDNDIVAGASKTSQRKRYAYFSVPYRNEYIALYVRKGESAEYPFSSLEDMLGEPFLLGIMDGVYYGEAFERLMNNAEFKEQVVEVSDAVNSLRQLTGNRVNGVLIDPLVAAYLIKKEGWNDKIERHPMPKILTGDICFMLSRASTSPELVDQINDCLARLKADGTLDDILQKYLKK